MRRLSHLILCVILVLVAPRALVAQGKQGVLAGEVVARETGTPLDHAMITVMSAAWAEKRGCLSRNGLYCGPFLNGCVLLWQNRI